MAEAHGEIPVAKSVHEHHDGRCGVRQPEGFFAGLGIGVDLGRDRMTNGGGKSRQYGGKVQRSPRPAAVSP